MSEFRISTELDRTFALASLRAEGARLSGTDWERFQSVRNRYAEAREEEVRSFNEHYRDRVDLALRKLIDEAGAPNRKLVHRWFGHDRFDAERLEKRAERLVREEHYKVMAKFEAAEIAEMSMLLDQVNEDRTPAKTMKPDFEKATDRRSGHDRRQSSDTASQAWAQVRARKR